MPQTDAGILLVVGAVFFLIGLLGGKFEIKDIKITSSTGNVARAILGIIGFVMMGIAISRFIFPPVPLQAGVTPTSTTPAPTLAEAEAKPTEYVQQPEPAEKPVSPTNTPVPVPTDTPVAKPTNTPKPTLSISSIPVFDTFDKDSFDDNKWLLEVSNPDMISYRVSQGEGQLCLDIQNSSGDPQDLFLRSRVSASPKKIEADLALVTGNGYFGLDTWGQAGANFVNYVLDSQGVLKTTYRFQGNTIQEKVFQSIDCCPASHRLGVNYGDNQVQYYFDDVNIGMHPGQGVLDGYGLTVTTYAHSEIKVCVDEFRIQF